MSLDVLFLALGCGLLFYGGDWLVDGIAGLAAHFRLPPVIIAFVVMGFGTSAPELFVSIDAMLAATPDIAVGNVVGSNIANLLLVLALAALIAPLQIDRDVLRIDGSAMLVAALLLWAVAVDGRISRPDAGVLVLGIVGYLTLRWRSLVGDETAADATSHRFASVLALCIVALLALPLGAHLFVEGAVGIADRFGIAEATIGLTVVALGTSLPELASCAAAALRRKSDMILGGILGSNVFNGSIVIGGAVLVAPVPVAQDFLEFWFPAMIGASLATFFS